ncbi:hypothetical protein N7451_000556 [Penicillium sp. IBT 35674x]|nr:hypothetical protein N7451_000556 [Penicillium sp. IBT 35674x]
MDQQETPVYRAFVPYGVEIIVDDLYFGTSGEYGTTQLALDLRPTDGEHGNGTEDADEEDENENGKDEDEEVEVDGGFTIHIIHEAYIYAVPHETLVCGMSWVEWLEKAASVRHVPRLVNTRTGGLSDLFHRIARFDAIRLLGLYKSNQVLYNREITPSAMEETRDLEVPCSKAIELEDMDPEVAVSGAVAMYEELSKRFHEDVDELRGIFEDFVSTARSPQEAHDSQPAIPSHIASPYPSRIDPELGIITSQTHYAGTLTNVTGQARAANFRETLQTAANPHRHTWNDVSGYDFSILSSNRLDRDINIGAAGELSSSVFCNSIFQASADQTGKAPFAKNVTVHPDYHNLAPWNGSETADIVYHDTDSALTSILIHEGQYLRMQSYALSLAAEPTKDDRVYMIFRVSKVISGNIGMKLNLDPEKLRQERRLIFTADTWSVRPPAL